MIAPLFGSITRPLLSPLVSGLRDELFGAFTPRSLFNDGSIGVLYDNNDFVEPTSWRRNLLTYSEQFDNAVWVKANATITANTVIAPDGTLTGDKLVETATTGVHRLEQTITVVSGALYTLTVYAKAAERQWLYLFEDSGSGFSTFNLSTGVVGTTGGSATTQITPVGNGWYRCSLTVTQSGTIGRYRVAMANSTTGTSYAGDGTSGLLIWGAQLELGASATTYQRITDFNSDFLAAFPNTTMFLDAAGTTPATVNGLVGLQLDKSQGLALGAEIRSSGAVGLVGTATAATYNTSTGVGTVTRVDASNQSYVQWTGLSGYYQIDITNTGAVAMRIRHEAGAAGTLWYDLAAGQSKAVIAPSLDGTMTLTTAGVPGTAAFTINSFKKISGNHRYQSTTGSKPVLRGTPTGANLVTNGDFASGTGWAFDAGWSISGGVASFTATGSQARLTKTLALGASKVYRVTYTVVSRSAGSVLFRLVGGAVVNGASRSAAGTYVEYLTTTTTISEVQFLTSTDFTGSVDNLEIVDVSAGSVTAPYGLQYDGVDDFLQTASVNFSATDKMFVCAGVRKLSDAALSVLVESSASVFVNPGAFWIATPDSAADNIQFRAGGTTTGNFVRTGLASPISMVIIGTVNISAPALGLRVNGSETLGIPVLGTGNFGNYPIYFGRRAGTSLPLSGLDFGFCIVGKTLTAAQIANVERWMAQRTGVTL